MSDKHIADCKYGRTQLCLFWAKDYICYHPDNKTDICNPSNCPIETKEEEIEHAR